MRIQTLSRNEAKIAMEEWIKNSKIGRLDYDYSILRSDLKNLYIKVKKVFEKGYDIDLYFGIEIYKFFNQKEYFNLQIASDDGFWMYLSIKVIPDVVAERWGNENESHYWKRSTRIWLKSIWWYIFLSWQGDEYKTISILKNNTTDEIMNLVERTGTQGYYLDVCRYIMYFYNKAKSIYKGKDISRNIFRKVMILHTARNNVIEPSLCSGGEYGYVYKLYKDTGIEI